MVDDTTGTVAKGTVVLAKAGPAAAETEPATPAKSILLFLLLVVANKAGGTEVTFSRWLPPSTLTAEEVLAGAT